MATLGVVVGRFQVPKLHAGHRFLLDYVKARHDKVLVILGVTRGLPSTKNPLSLMQRIDVIGQEYPDVLVVAALDHPNDQAWSDALDSHIGITAKASGSEGAVLYGSRDSFMPYYTGIHPTLFVPMVNVPEHTSGTAVRKSLEYNHSSPDFRAGIIHAVEQRLPLAYPVVDVAVMRKNNKGILEVLLGSKLTDLGQRRFIGGFVDPTDENLEMAVRREVGEETSGIEISDINYIGSARVDDWRYRGTPDKIISSMFVAQHIFGSPKAADDLHSLDWVNFHCLYDNLAPTHKPLADLLTKHIRWS